MTHVGNYTGSNSLGLWEEILTSPAVSSVARARFRPLRHQVRKRREPNRVQTHVGLDGIRKRAESFSESLRSYLGFDLERRMTFGSQFFLSVQWP